MQVIPVLRDNKGISGSVVSLNDAVSTLWGTSVIVAEGRGLSRVDVILPQRGYSVSLSDISGDGGSSTNSMKPAKYSSR